MKQFKCSMSKKIESLGKKNEDRRRKDRYGHSVRRFTANDLSLIPDIKIKKIIPPTKEDVRKCAVTRNGQFVVFFDVDSESFKLEYNPHLEGYDGMRSAARENCSIQNLATGQTWNCTGVYTLPEWITYGGYSDYTTDHLDDPAVQAFMNPSEQMVLTQFIKPFAKDYLGVDATESKKRSEKRTVTTSYDVFTYDELSDEAKEKVKDEFLRVRQEYESDVFSDSCGTMLKELFPNSDLKIEYSLSYSQGDGFNTYGSLDVNDLINVDLSAYPFKDSKYITPLSDKTAIKSACEKAEISDIEVPENGRYGYSMADRIELVPSYEVELSDEDVALLNELENFAQDVMGVFNSQCETDGYDWFYEATDEEVKDWADANDYEFTEDGELA